MFEKILLISLFTMIIHCTETLAYAIRLAGIRIGKLAVALSLTGIVLLVSRTSNLLQGPMTGRIIDLAKKNADINVEEIFRIIMISASFGTLLAIFIFPTFVSLAMRMIARLEIAGSLPQLIKDSVNIQSIKQVRHHIRLPQKKMLSKLRVGGIPKRLLLMNCLVTSIYTIGVLSALYASLLQPDFATVATQSTGLINGFATVIFTVLVDPQVALLTDKALHNKNQLDTMNKVFGLLMISRFAGTLLAQVLFVPAAYWIAWISPLF